MQSSLKPEIKAPLAGSVAPQDIFTYSGIRGVLAIAKKKISMTYYVVQQ